MDVSIEGETLRIELRGWEKVWSVHGSFSIPLDHVVEARTSEPKVTWKELRAPGTFLPGVIKAGTYYTSRGREFWYVTRGKPFLIIELRDERYRRIILASHKNEDWARLINERVRPQAGAPASEAVR